MCFVVKIIRIHEPLATLRLALCAAVALIAAAAAAADSASAMLTAAGNAGDDTVRLAHLRSLAASKAASLDSATRAELDALSLTSSEGVRNLVALLGGDVPPELAGVPVFAPHPRIVEQARLAGFTRVIETAPGDAGLLDALEAHFDNSLG